MFLATARALAVQTSDEDLQLGRIYPPLSRIRAVSLAIAIAVAEVAHRSGLAQHGHPISQYSMMSRTEFGDLPYYTFRSLPLRKQRDDVFGLDQFDVLLQALGATYEMERGRSLERASVHPAGIGSNIRMLCPPAAATSTARLTCC